MKKLFVYAMAALMGVFMASCAGGDSPASKATEIFESVKDKLATMPKDELKTKALELAEVIKPVMTKSIEVAQKLFTDDNFTLEDAAKAYQEAGFSADDIQTINKVVEDFNTEVAKNPAWGELQMDSDFSKQWLGALGMGDLGSDVEEAADSLATEVTEEVTEPVTE